MSPHRRLLLATLLASLTITAAAADPLAAGPRAGKYRILSYGATGRPPLFLGSVVLDGGHYTAYLPGDKPSGQGSYRYDAASHQVTWISGPYAGQWGGDFSIDREGKTHKIRLKSTTIATNSSDSP
jgi:hypothetical protein